MSNTIKIKKGFDIKLKGQADLSIGKAVDTNRYAVKPTDFLGLKPKLCVKADDIVKAGTPLFFDKSQPEVKFTSPVSGKVVAINRGERRRILEIEIESNGKFESVDFPVEEIKSLNRDKVKKNLLESGLWPFMVQRPFGVIPQVNEMPRDIFITSFDSSPLAPDYEFTLAGEMENIQAGIDVVSKLSKGKVYLGLRPGSKFSTLKGVEINYLNGPHPAGNIGIQLHKIAPLNKGEIVWTLNLQTLLYIGKLFKTGKLNLERLVAVCGSEVKKPQYIKAVAGASVKTLINGNTKNETNERLISGNVLTGEKLEENGFTRLIDNQVTVIPEGNEIEPFGWIAPGFNKFTAGKTFLSKLMPRKSYVLNANYHGGERAFVVSGQYEKVLPMDIYPVYLLKAILVNDIDKMENLGIYEVVEEDMALCEYVCSSKIEVQSILRNGINTMIKELA
ncbi:MAG: Na(+)-translocating NADH-quinone reductase subunit A [Prolixibacteraceae bacterium]|nr:Na(+)-translocating NADH-quinone reductase subunit A [Prolixibacteraceae bacterium]MBN2648628.1 Na(+)-translocating NADH-quinone reductase subunit A [Prolixibacteraceae bacterium]